jgi:hypothetical protein
MEDCPVHRPQAQSVSQWPCFLPPSSSLPRLTGLPYLSFPVLPLPTFLVLSSQVSPRGGRPRDRPASCVMGVPAVVHVFFSWNLFHALSEAVTLAPPAFRTAPKAHHPPGPHCCPCRLHSAVTPLLPSCILWDSPGDQLSLGAGMLVAMVLCTRMHLG